jgi:4-amino-4-deoxy-L-arabinose transferase-like glycosyltransferase
MTFSKSIRNDLIALSILIAVSIVLIFYQFGQIPKGLHYDEIEFAKLALSLQNQPYTPYSPLATGHATVYFYMLLTSIKLLGENTIALRLPSAIFGVLNVILFYFIVKRIFEKSTEFPFFVFFLTLTFITLKWYFNFARFAFEATFLLFLEFVSILSMLTYDEKKKWIFLILSGLFAGLAYNSYTAGRFFVVIPPFLLLNNWKGKELISANNFKKLLLYGIPFILLIMPISIYLSKHQDIRIYQLLYLQNSELTILQKLQFFGANVVSTVNMFLWKGDMNGVHNYPGKPALNLFIGLLFILGLGLSAKNWKKNFNLFFLAYFFISIFPTLLTYPWENPHMLRTFTVIPALIYFVGLSVLFLVSISKKYKSITMYALMCCLIISSLYEVRGYFKYQVDVLDQAFRYSKELPYYLRLSDKQLKNTLK